MRDIVIHTDGSCLNNPGRGGWAAVIDDGSTRRELSGGARLSTNNRMELKAAIEALRSVPVDAHSIIKVYTDSQLMVNGIELGWARKWRANNWKRNRNDKAENPDLWKQLLDEIEKRKVKFVWTKAHVGTLENERCDELAKRAAENATTVDEVYEVSKSTPDASQSILFGSPVEEDRYKVTLDKARSSLTLAHPKYGSLVVRMGELNGLLQQINEAIISSKSDS